MYTKITEILRKNANIERASKRITEKTIKEIREGFFITCKKEMTVKFPDKTTQQIKKGTHWLVLPPKETKDIDTKVRNNKTYYIQRAKAKVAPVFAEEQAFFDAKKVEINGCDMKEHFTKGILTKKQIKKEGKKYRISINKTGILKYKYHARNRDGNLIAGENTVDDTIKTALDTGWRFIEYVNEDGNRITFDAVKGKETNEGVYDVIAW